MNLVILSRCRRFSAIAAWLSVASDTFSWTELVQYVFGDRIHFQRPSMIGIALTENMVVQGGSVGLLD